MLPQAGVHRGHITYPLCCGTFVSLHEQAALKTQTQDKADEKIGQQNSHDNLSMRSAVEEMCHLWKKRNKKKSDIYTQVNINIVLTDNLRNTITTNDHYTTIEKTNHCTVA